MFSTPTSTIFCFLFLLILVITAEAAQRHRSNEQRRWTNTAHTNGDACRTFQSCCRQTCQSSTASSNCTIRSGKANGQCICGGGRISTRSEWFTDDDSDEDYSDTGDSLIIIIDGDNVIVRPPSPPDESEDGGGGGWHPTTLVRW